MKLSIDSFGRIVIPRAIRRELGSDQLDATWLDGVLTLTATLETPVLTLAADGGYVLNGQALEETEPTQLARSSRARSLR
jgi:hypothetical protein